MLKQVGSKWFMQKLKPFSKNRDKPTDAYLAQIAFPRISLIKYDGRQTTIHIAADGEVTYYSSGGHMFKLLDDGIFAETFMAQGVYFAEMNGEGSESKLGDRVDAGIQTTCVTNTKKGIYNKHKPSFKIFDCIDEDDWYAGVSKTSFIDRFETLKSFVPTEFLAENMECLNYEHHLMFKKFAIKRGYEGVVSTHFGQRWIGKGTRKHDSFKDKDRPTADLMCVEELEGEGKYVGKVGSLRLEDASGNEVCCVGSGLTDYQRSLWGAYKGKIIEVKYEQVMKHKLIQPIFVTIRDDKTKAEQL